MAFWKRKKEPEFISLGLNREATEEEKAIAARRHEGPEPDVVDKLKAAVASTRENLAERIESVVGVSRKIDPAVLDSLEEALISADIGVAVVTIACCGVAFGGVITYVPTYVHDADLGPVATFFLSYTAAAVLTRVTAGDVRARYVIEGANHPTDPEADELLARKKIVVLPDIFANAGGVTVSYLEWVQNLQQFYWDEARVNEVLRTTMRAAYADLKATVQRFGCDLRTAAFALGVSRVARATAMRGL